MGFVREELNEERRKNEITYLNSIGVRNIYGESIGLLLSNVVVDRERNNFLIPCGATNPNRDNKKIYFYSLCINGEIIDLQVRHCEKGNIRDKSREVEWIIDKIEYKKIFNLDIGENELKEIIRDALTAESYDGPFIPDNTKNVTVEFNTAITMK